MSLALIRTTSAVELNPEQSSAVEHGIGNPGGPGPLLVVAGAGSGKTAMLAHWVAALILAGADPKRIMLATFSRRAAAELQPNDIAEDEHGNPVSFFQLKAMAEQGGREDDAKP